MVTKKKPTSKKQSYKVSEYTLIATNGRKIRKATVVTTPSGKKIRFMDKISKKQAIQQAKKIK